MASMACRVRPFPVAVIVTFVSLLAGGTGCVVTVKVAAVSPSGIATLAGTAATALFVLDSATVAPPAGAGAPIVTVP
jgi:hypothetical protein